MFIDIKSVCLESKRNKAKVSPKLTKKRPISDFFRFSQTLHDLKELLWSLSTPYKGLMFSISSKWYDWNSSESEGKRHKPTPLSHMQLLFFLPIDRQNELFREKA